MRPRALALGVISGVVFVDLLGLAIILPSLPFFVTDLGASSLQLGLIFTSYSLAQAIAAPVLGRLSDRYGRRNIVLLSLAGSTTSFAIAGLADTVTHLLIARAIAGMCGGSISVAYAFVSDVTEPRDRTRAMSWVGTSIGLAFTVGPGLGAVLAPSGFGVVCWVAAAIGAANLLAAWIILPRATPRPAKHAHIPSANGQVSARPSLVRAAERLAIITLICGGAVTTASFVSMETTIALLTDARFSFSASTIGWLLAAAGLAMLVIQLAIANGAVSRFSDWAIAMTAVTVSAGSLTAIPLCAEIGTVAAVLTLSAAYGALGVVLMSLLSQTGPMSTIGARMGTAQSATSAGRAIGPLFAGALYEVHPTTPYAAAAIITTMVAVTIFTTSRRLGRARSTATATARG